MPYPIDEKQCLERIIETGRRLHAKDYIAAADGNISYRLSDRRILITPSGYHKGFLKKEQIAVMNLEGEVIAGTPSSESPMHLEVYRCEPEARAVIHAHAPTCTAWSIARPELTRLPDESMAELILAVGEVPVVPYQRPGTEDMAQAVARWVDRHQVMVLARHGVLSWGRDLEEAYMGVERVEHAARILWLAEVIGGLTSLPADEVQALRDIRKKAGDRIL